MTQLEDYLTMSKTEYEDRVFFEVGSKGSVQHEMTLEAAMRGAYRASLGAVNWDRPGTTSEMLDGLRRRVDTAMGGSVKDFGMNLTGMLLVVLALAVQHKVPLEENILLAMGGTHGR